MIALNLQGQKFGRLTAIRDVGSKNNRRMWLCLCDCGAEVVVSSSALKWDGAKSCGCLQKEMRVSANTKHGYCGTRLYRIWKGVISRCNIKSSTDYKWYGALGVKVCDEWRNFIAFKDWALSNGYNDTLTIDRINVYGDYTPDNCKWSTISEQNSNRRCSRRNKNVRPE